MLVTVNPDKEKVTIMSLPRDSVIAPVGYEEEFPQKLNSAYEYGSAKTTIQTIQKWLNVPIDYYALVNMGGLEKVIDQMNGIKVKSPLTFGYNPYTAHNDGDYIYNFTKGSSTFTLNAKGQIKTYKKMDGQAALAFSRMRYDDPQGDYGRQKRQRMVLQTIVDDAKSNPTKLINQKFLNTLSDSTQTDLTFGDMLTVASRYLSAAKTIKQDNAQGTEVNLTSGSSELISQDEKQRVTNVLRKSLGLKHKKTGTLYGGKVSNATLIMNGLPASQSATEEAADTTTDSTYGTVTDTDTYVGY
jgi:LCP family protein required for cell wall assembly